MNEVPTKRDFDARFEQMAKVLANKADKKDVETIHQKLNKLLKGELYHGSND